ncbi:MAG: exodeoxyribonuclease VII large subunit [Eubacterium sp.]|nr:exodeoxyribonuclease VII large subunit [Eubacterium sp.]
MKRVFSVSQVNSYIRRIFDGDYALRNISIKGEVSNCKYHSSGHIYFTLKDAGASIRCIMFSSDRAGGLNFRMENGQQVTASGNITVYGRDGTYQLYARKIVSDGLGELYIRYEELKKELYAAGYFDFERKKELPPYPERIGIVTAPTGAAIKDITSIAGRRNPFVQLILYPARVQGEGAAKTIAEGIRYFDRNDVDIIIIGRGGGSIEDLWAFNEREVADAIFAAKTPVISGTGHEIDMTIADYCADVRAATPSAACELAIPDIYSILQQITQYRVSLDLMMERKTDGYRQRYERCRRLLDARHPGAMLLKQQMRLTGLKTALHVKMEQILSEKKHRMDILSGKLTALSPSERLRGGYVFAQDDRGHPISSVSQLTAGQAFTLIFADGQIRAVPLPDPDNN